VTWPRDEFRARVASGTTRNGSRTVCDAELTPRGAHAQGDAFLRFFLDTFDSQITARSADACIDHEESTSYLFNHRRRIDVLIAFGASGIGIENKPWAGEQTDQIADYFRQLVLQRTV
jgi:hypothetical protein